MKTSTLFAFAMVAFSQFSTATAAVAPTKIIARTPQETTEEQGKQSPSEFPVPDAMKSQGCFGADGNYTVEKGVEFISAGSCNKRCVSKKKNVMALHGGQCLCGDYYPPVKSLNKDSKCNFPCPAYPIEACGSLGDPGFWSVFNTGIDMNIENLPEPKDDEDKDKDSDKSTAASSSTAAAATSSTAAATAPAATTSDAGSGEEDGGDEEEKKGPNTAGIAAGVVVGVVAVAAGIGGLFFWMRRKRNAEIEEDHRRNAAVNAFINGSKPPSSHGSISMTDSRLDPVLAHRRMSDGSIADNQDYSRRILRVTNA